MRQSRDSAHRARYRFHSSSIRFYAYSLRSSPLRLFLTVFCFACDILPQKDDTEGEQQQAQWLTAGRLVVDTDPKITLVRLRAEPLDSTRGGHHVLLARFEFNPTPTLGDEYALTVALDLGDIRALQRATPYDLGRTFPAYGTATCLCRPMKPDSVRGTFTISQRGMAQIVGRIDATLFFTAWDDSTRHSSYRLRQRIDGMR